MDEQSTEVKKSMSPMLIAGIIIVVLLVAGGVFVAGKASKKQSSQQAMQEMVTPTTTATAVPTETMKEATPTAMVGTVKEFTVSGGNYYFKPSQITVKKGDTVKITFTNNGGFHDFVLDGYNVKTDVIGSGKSQTITFTADKVGSFQYYCSVANHRAMGMTGTLIVQ